MTEILAAQRAYFASDERIKERVAMWANATPEERLRELRSDDFLLERIAPHVIERLHALRSGLPADTIEILERLRGASR